MPQFNTLEKLEAEIVEMGNHSSEYWDKQVHVVPKSKTVERTDYILGLCKDKVVLHIGCTGQLDKLLLKTVKRCYGIDKNDTEEPGCYAVVVPNRPDYYKVDLDYNSGSLPHFKDVEIIVCGEVLEHLSNPGTFLQNLRRLYPVPVVFTVPNAFCTSGAEWLLKRGRENVNKDHVCYYSYTTIRELLRRAGYSIDKHYWYGGKPYISEGLIVEAI